MINHEGINRTYKTISKNQKRKPVPFIYFFEANVNKNRALGEPITMR